MLPVMFPDMEPEPHPFMEPLFFIDLCDFIGLEDFIEPEVMELDVMLPEDMFPDDMVELWAKAGAAANASSAAATVAVLSMEVSSPRLVRGGRNLRLSVADGNKK